MLLSIIDSATGETVGSVNIVGMDDEAILAWLVAHGYLAGEPDLYDISRNYPFAEGEIVVIDQDTNQPLLKLEFPPEVHAP